MDSRVDKLAKLKEELSKHLKLEVTDNNKLLNLSHEIASFDESAVRFSIDAGVIDRLGQELVARQETAVSELIKNAYDADATNVTLTFIDSDSIGGTLTIEDNGEGMTHEDLTNGFMRISSTSKLHNPLSKKFRRQRAGQKGIGRFAVQRLGTKLRIITQTAESDSALQLTVDWDDYQIDNNLITISNKLEVIEKQKESGTTIVIEGLRDKWSKAAIRRTYRYTSSIIQPVLPDEEVLSQSLDDESFDVTFNKKVGDKTDVIADQGIMIYEHATATIEGHIDNDTGQGVFRVTSKHLDLDETDIISNDPDRKEIPFTKLKNVRFKAFYFVYDSSSLSKTHQTSIRNLLQKEGGLKLYRNGFKVPPYGDTGDDWLELDKSQRRRTILFPHGNINFHGFVELIDNDNTFNETSSREGLIENEEFRELRNFVHRALITATNRVASKRNIKAVTNQEKGKNGWEDIELTIKNIALSIEELDALENEEDNATTRKRRKRKLKKAKDNLQELAEQQTEEAKKLMKERSMLRVLSSVGLTVSQFIHEIKYYMDNIQSDIRYLNTDLAEGSEAQQRVATLESNFNNFHDYTAYFNEVVSANVIRELYPQNIRHVVKKFIDSINADANNAGITFEAPIFHSGWLYTRPMHPSEWSSVLFNLYTNAKKAIKRQAVDGKILIECGIAEDKVYLEFSDNGDGIKKEHEEHIFEEFFTTTSAQSLSELNENTEILGTGLGLKIVKDIIKSYRGDIYVASPKEEYATCIRIEVNKASEKDLQEHGL